MDFEQVIRTILKKSLGVSAKNLVVRVHAKTGLSRSTVYEHLHSMNLRGKIYREKGFYWLEKPKAQTGFISSLLDWWERRARRKRLERERLAREIAAPSLAHFRYRAEVDGIRFYKHLVDEEERIAHENLKPE